MVRIKRYRTKAGLAVAAYCLLEGLWDHEIPFRLDKTNKLVLIGFLLILLGLIFRLASHGCIRKKEVLATTGVYSLCRHPLYLGSILLTYGVCFLLNDAANFYFATVYFAIFYTVTIVWEEIRVAERYGEAHAEYRRSTPLILPFGRFRSGEFQWRQVFRLDGVALICTTGLLLVAIQLMAVFM